MTNKDKTINTEHAYKLLDEQFSSITISLSSPEQILANSFGHIKKSETINYRTFKPERGGLFCSKIFGPVKDYVCLCGKYKKLKHRGIVCEKCDVEVILSKVRRERSGHIELACPVAHTWFYRTAPSCIGTLLDITAENLEKVLYYEKYVVLYPGNLKIEPGSILTEKQYKICKSTCTTFKAGMGASAIKFLLNNINLDNSLKKVQHILKITTTKNVRTLKKLQLLTAFKKHKTNPAWLILDVLPVMPPDLRPLIRIDGGKFVSSDLNDLYRKVINRNNRLKKLLELNAPKIIVRNEKRMLQEAVDALFDNSKNTKNTTNTRKQPLKSITELLKGKEGRFRQNLLGKRVDYSGRSVVVAGPWLSLHQCGIPKKMAIEIFKPYLYHILLRKGFTTTVREAKALVLKEGAEIWDILEEIVYKYPVLLNRAPTLHRLGVQAFEPILVSGQAILLHPLVCQAFNADFDGDQMAVHIPLSLEAQLEARVLMLATNNILSPSTGEPIIAPTKDIVLGLHYLTTTRFTQNTKHTPLYTFSNLREVEKAFESGCICVHSNIRVRLTSTNKTQKILTNTTVGRILLFTNAPEGLPFDLFNKPYTKNTGISLLSICYDLFGIEKTVLFANNLMQLGFKHATNAGISIALCNLVTPVNKKQTINTVQKHAATYTKHYKKKLITTQEYTKQIIHLWSITNKKITKDVISTLQKNLNGLNPLYLMYISGARGSKTQILQLTGMRGLISKPDGTIFPIPVIANFREGLSIFEYFISTHGARKGLADTALKTANSGYLTRKLVDVAQNLVIVEEDCATKHGIPVQTRIFGATVVSKEKQQKDRITLDTKTNNGATLIRSPITCETPAGICVKCYGDDPATRLPVEIGTAVGVIAAQSIGEPGTQLTMRTFHTGGAAVGEFTINNLQTDYAGIVQLDNVVVLHNMCVGYGGIIRIQHTDGKELVRYAVTYGAFILVKNNMFVTKNTVLTQWDPNNIPIIATQSGAVSYVNMINNCTIVKKIDKTTGVAVLKVKKVYPGKRPHILINNYMKHPLSVGTVILVDNKTLITAGTILATIKKLDIKQQDITQGLLKITDLFEARSETSVTTERLAEHSGIVVLCKATTKTQQLLIVNKEKNILGRYVIPLKARLCINHGDTVTRGVVLVWGNTVNLKNILRACGTFTLIEHLLKEIQTVFYGEGVHINNKHIEIILRQMMLHTVIIKSNSYKYPGKELVLKRTLKTYMEKMQSDDSLVLRHSETVLGITKAALKSQSFLSAASFQETAKILANATLENKTDFLQGLKENVMAGFLVPCGTGFFKKREKLNNLLCV